MPQVGKLHPRFTSEARPFRDGWKEHRPLLPRCRACKGSQFSPRARCPFCSSSDLEWVPASGRARLHSYVANYGPAVGSGAEPPSVTAVVELEEGPRTLAGLVDIESDLGRLKIGMPLRGIFGGTVQGVAIPKV